MASARTRLLGLIVVVGALGATAALSVIAGVNKDPFPHNVSADAAGLHSGDLEPDRPWKYRAVTRGTFPYVCTLHPGMSGVVRVN